MSERTSGAAATDESRAAARRGQRRDARRGPRPRQALPAHAGADLPQAGRRRARGRRRLLRRHARRDARPRRRVGLRQVDDRAAARCGCSTRRAARSRSRARRSPDIKRRAAQAAAPRRADDLPGPVLVAEPAQDGRLDHRRAVLDPRHETGEGERKQGRAGADGHGRAQPRALQPLPARVLRRPAPAHRRRARDRAASRS